MIYIIVGNDIKKRNEYIHSLSLVGESTRLDQNTITKEGIIDLALSQNLFNENQVLVADGILSSDDFSFSKENLVELQNSPNTYLF